MMTEEATIEVFTSEDCGRCETVLKRANKVSKQTKAEVVVRDIEEERSIALARGVFSVPTTVVNEEVTLQGVPSSDEIRDAVVR